MKVIYGILFILIVLFIFPLCLVWISTLIADFTGSLDPFSLIEAAFLSLSFFAYVDLVSCLGKLKSKSNSDSFFDLLAKIKAMEDKKKP